MFKFHLGHCLCQRLRLKLAWVWLEIKCAEIFLEILTNWVIRWWIQLGFSANFARPSNLIYWSAFRFHLFNCFHQLSHLPLPMSCKDNKRTVIKWTDTCGNHNWRAFRSRYRSLAQMGLFRRVAGRFYI